MNQTTLQSKPASHSHLLTHVDASEDYCATRDGQILDQVKQALHESGFEQLRRLQTYCDQGRISLKGRVSTYYLKQVAQETVRRVSDVRTIDNDLRVIWSR